MNTTNKILSEISAGELMDKITILEIKKVKITDPEKQVIINKELNSLHSTYQTSLTPSPELQEQITKLKNINLTLWDIEEGKRECERQKDLVTVLFNWPEVSTLKMTIELRSKQKLTALPTLLFQKLKAIKLINLNLNLGFLFLVVQEAHYQFQLL